METTIVGLLQRAENHFRTTPDEESRSCRTSIHSRIVAKLNGRNPARQWIDVYPAGLDDSRIETLIREVCAFFPGLVYYNELKPHQEHYYSLIRDPVRPPVAPKYRILLE